VSEDALNPYASPVVADPLAPEEAGKLWMVHGNHLLVRDGARLPPVSLFGEDGGELTTSHQIFATSSGASMLGATVPFAIAVLVMVFIAIVSDRVAVLEGALAFFVSSRLLRRFTKVSRSMTNIQCHLSIPALKARARRDRWRGWLMMVALAGFILFATSGQIEQSYVLDDDERAYQWWAWFMGPLLLMTAVCFFGSLIWLVMEPGLKSVRYTGGWSYLRGVPASSLTKLAAMSTEPPPLRLRKIYTLYQYRLPMGILLGPRRNPLLMMVVAIMKVTRSPAFVRRNFHWSEARRGVQPDRDLAERIAEVRSRPEFAGWEDLGCSRIDSPQGELRVMTARLASPDRRHFCHITLARISKARAYVEVVQIDFRTWTADGRCLITCSQRSFPRLPDYLDFQRVRGNAARLWSRHLQRCERATPVAVESADELRRLLEKESEDHAALLRAAGNQGPVEEVEMPGDWDDVAKAS
jgi:hypothetical protein